MFFSWLSQVNFAIQKGNRSTQSSYTAVTSTAVSDPDIEELEQTCYNALVECCKELAVVAGVYYTSIMNLQVCCWHEFSFWTFNDFFFVFQTFKALRVMARQLPEAVEDMLKIPHVTKANSAKYGQKLLEITQSYAAQKACRIANVD